MIKKRQGSPKNNTVNMLGRMIKLRWNKSLKVNEGA
jgi:hypothetical protein